jgi:hypothetical protein
VAGPGGMSVSAQMFESCAVPGTASREGGFAVLVLTAQGTACNAREVVAAAGVDGDGAVGKIGVSVLTVEEERSQRRTSPSEPPERRMGCTGGHVGQGCLMAKCRRCVRSWGLNSKIGCTTDLFFMSTQDNPFSWNEYRLPAQSGHAMHVRAGSQVCKRIPVILMVENMCNTSSRPLRPITVSAIMVVRASTGAYCRILG